MIRPRKKRRWVHLVVMARVDKPQVTLARVAIDRERGVVTINRLRAHRRYTIQLSTLVELGMGRLMRQEAERRLGIRSIEGA